MGKLETRRQEIVKILAETPLITVTELAETLHVTMQTIRKDLAALETEHKVMRIHGGAALMDRDEAAVPYSLRKKISSEGKRKIAHAARTLIMDGDSLLLESSTTNAALCEALLEMPELLKTLVIVTNSMYIAQCLEMGNLCDRMLLLGGWSRASEHCTMGSFVIDTVDKIRVDKAFLSGAALSGQFTLSAYYEHDMQFQQHAIACANQTFLLLDKSKYPRSGVMRVATMDKMDCLITDIRFSEKEQKTLREIGVKLILV